MAIRTLGSCRRERQRFLLARALLRDSQAEVIVTVMVVVMVVVMAIVMVVVTDYGHEGEHEHEHEHEHHHGHHHDHLRPDPGSARGVGIGLF